jgi:TolB protein
MNDHSDFEARLATALAVYADRAPIEVDPISITAAVAHGRSRRSWRLFNRRVSWLVIGTVLALLAVGAALVAGSYLLRPHTSIGGGGLMLIDQADLPDGGNQATSEHIFGFDESTGDRVPIVDWPVTTKSYGWMWASWSPDRKHALVFDVGGGVRGIVDVASHRLSALQLKSSDSYTSFAERLAWARGSDRIASIVSNDTTNTQGSILISDLTGQEIGRLAMPPGWTAGRPTWSPDGSSLILAGCLLPCVDGASDEHLLLIPIDGSPMRVLLEPAVSYGPAVWSPDGSTIAFESSVGIQTMDAATGRQSTVTRGNDQEPDWSPDGRRIAFARLDDQGANGAIYVVDVYSKDLRRLTNYTDIGTVSNPDWSPDGTMLTFGRQNGVYSGVWVVGADGGSPRLVIENATSDW